MALDGKHVLITGSSRGIGRGIALKLAEAGVKIAVHYYQNEAAANQTLAMVGDRGSEGFLVQADVSEPDQIFRMFKQVQSEFGSLDIFVNNARPEIPEFFQPPMNITPGQFDAAYSTQAKAFLVGAQQAARIMRDGGRIIAITYPTGSRTGGLQPWVGMGSPK